MADKRTLALPLFSVLFYLIGAEENKYYVMSPCYRFAPFTSLKIDGAVIQKGEFKHNYECVLTFETSRTWLRFLIRFESFFLKNCEESLTILDYRNMMLLRATCETKMNDLRPLISPTGLIRVLYRSELGSKSSNFKLILTALRETKIPSRCEFRCFIMYYCIDKDLVCDGIDHCGDNSDEDRCLDISDTTFKILGLGVSVFIIIMVCIFIVCSICIIGFILCLCRKNVSQRSVDSVACQTPSSTTTSVQPNVPYPRQPEYPYIPPNAYSYQPENPPPYPGGPYLQQQQAVMYDVNRDQIYFK